MYQCPKGGLNNAFPVPKATLETVFMKLAKKITIHLDVWKHILREFDQSTFAIDQSQNEPSSNLRASTGDLRKSGGMDFNIAQHKDLMLLAGKIEFSNFLKAI